MCGHVCGLAMASQTLLKYEEEREQKWEETRIMVQVRIRNCVAGPTPSAYALARWELRGAGREGNVVDL
jgi:hypothetical protein